MKKKEFEFKWWYLPLLVFVFYVGWIWLGLSDVDGNPFGVNSGKIETYLSVTNSSGYSALDLIESYKVSGSEDYERVMKLLDRYESKLDEYEQAFEKYGIGDRDDVVWKLENARMQVESARVQINKLAGLVETRPIENIKSLYKVTRVIDGDTVELISGEMVRLICIDTPERGEDGYSEATDYLESLVLNEDVELVKDISEIDRYGRLLRYIYLEDGTFVNEKIVYYGYGKAYPYSPDILLCPEIQEAEQYAKQNNLRIWKETIEEPTEENPSNSDIICSYNAYNCGDFSSCSEVMEVFNSCSYDIHYLDGDDDGIPCESLCG